MKFFCQVTVVSGALLACASGPTTVPREAKSDDTALPAQQAAEPSPGLDQNAANEKQTAQAKADSSSLDPQDSKQGAAASSADGSKAEGSSKPDKSEKGTTWSSGSSESVIERARRQLKRRCDAGSEAACRAAPDLDQCRNLRRQPCANLGDLFAKGASGVDKNPEHARDFWMRACDIESKDCLRYGRAVFEFDGLESREAAAEKFFHTGCTRDFRLCAQVGRFYQEKQQAAQARKFFDMGCAGGQAESCRAKE
jgi:hypothetical protein